MNWIVKEYLSRRFLLFGALSSRIGGGCVRLPFHALLLLDWRLKEKNFHIKLRSVMALKCFEVECPLLNALWFDIHFKVHWGWISTKKCIVVQYPLRKCAMVECPPVWSLVPAPALLPHLHQAQAWHWSGLGLKRVLGLEEGMIIEKGIASISKFPILM